jgi:uncharacterized membrane protein YvlD (DUF360 family)
MDDLIDSIQARHVVVAVAVALLLGAGVNLLADVVIRLIQDVPLKPLRIGIQFGLGIFMLITAAIIMMLSIGKKSKR